MPCRNKKAVRRTTHYSVLGMPPASTFEQLHAKFLELAQQHHPDVHGTKHLERFQEITFAWASLKDARKRKLYDAQLRMLGGQCASCTGTGVRVKSIGFTRTVTALCFSCAGTGQQQEGA